MIRRIFSFFVGASVGLFFGNCAVASQVLAGDFSVTNAGAARYSIPFSIPSGVAGLEPKLAAVYDSQMGNGLLGVGWGVQGLSSITRCPRTKAQDGVGWVGGISLTTSDRLCLDGRRLVPIADPSQGGAPGAYGANSTFYNTERNGFLRIQAFGELAGLTSYFKVSTKEGLLLTFGGTANSRVSSVGSAAVTTWALSKVEDGAGNNIAIDYMSPDQALGVLYPVSVSYGSAGDRRISFLYEERPDVEVSYTAGAKATMKLRLSAVEVFVADRLLYSTKFLYQVGFSGRSRLASVKTCSFGSCLPSTLISGFNDEGGFFLLPGFPNNGYSLRAGFKYPNGYTETYRFGMGDFNGDGRMDLFHNVSEKYMHVWLSNGDGTFDIRPRFPQDDGYIMATRYTEKAGNYYIDVYSGVQVPGDFNGDGKTDLLHFRNKNEVRLWLSQGDGTFQIGLPASPPGYNIETLFSRGFVGDFNGDGRSDIVHIANSSYLHLWQSNGDGSFDIRPPFGSGYDLSANNYNYKVGDFNGDGVMDLVHLATPKYLHVWISKGDGTFDIKGAFPNSGYGLDSNNYNFLVADFNGDGKSDLLHLATPNYLHVWLSRGDGTFDIKQAFPNNGYGLNSNAYNFKVGDFNGDGKADLVHFANSRYFHIWYSRGDGTFLIGPQEPNSGYPIDANGYNFLVGDVSGDSRDDLVHLATENYLHVWRKQSSNQPADAVAAVQNGLREGVAIEYRNGLDPNFHLAEQPLWYPKKRSTASPFMVSRVKRTNADISQTSETYSYSGGYSDLDTGRGFNGLTWLRARNESSGLISTTFFRQDWPYVGLPSKLARGTSEQEWSNLGVVAYDYGCLDYVSAEACIVQPGRIYFPYLKQYRTSGTRDVASSGMVGAELPGAQVDIVMDRWGNVVQLTEQNLKTDGSLSGFRKVTAHDYSPVDLNKWHLGRVLRTTVATTTPDNQ